MDGKPLIFQERKQSTRHSIWEGLCNSELRAKGVSGSSTPPFLPRLPLPRLESFTFHRHQDRWAEKKAFEIQVKWFLTILVAPTSTASGMGETLLVFLEPMRNLAAL